MSRKDELLKLVEDSDFIGVTKFDVAIAFGVGVQHATKLLGVLIKDKTIIKTGLKRFAPEGVKEGLHNPRENSIYRSVNYG